jgi:hypothetical protein
LRARLAKSDALCSRLTRNVGPDSDESERGDEMKHMIGVLLVFLAWSATAGNLLAQVQSAAYEEASIPESWISKAIAGPIASASEYPRTSVRSAEIAEFTKIYGVPARLLMPKDRKGYSYLVYDLAEGYKLLVYVPSISDSRFTAAQLFRSNGEAEGPVLK